MRWPKWFKVRLGDEIVEGMTAQARLASDLVDSLSYLAPYLHHCRPLPTILTCVTRLGRIRNSVTDVRPATRASLESTITGGCHHPYGASDHEGAARPLLALAKAQGSRARRSAVALRTQDHRIAAYRPAICYPVSARRAGCAPRRAVGCTDCARRSLIIYVAVRSSLASSPLIFCGNFRSASRE